MLYPNDVNGGTRVVEYFIVLYVKLQNIKLRNT